MDKDLALKVAVVSLFNFFEDEFVEKFGMEKLKECSVDTEHLARQNVKVEDVLHEALYGQEE